MLLLAFATMTLLTQAHSHNDYEHRRPLLDALDQGFLSVEADVYLVDGELRVGHNPEDLKAGRTLEALYLDPLAQRVAQNNGTVYGQPGMLTLVVDIKAEGEKVQAALQKTLPKYRKMLTDRHGATVDARAVQILLSGSRTTDCAAGDGFLFKDGKLADLGDEPFRTPGISENYTRILGTELSPLPAENLQKLKDLVAKTHAGGKTLRLWGAPDGPVTWKELLDAKVDLINTDHLADFRAFLLK